MTQHDIDCEQALRQMFQHLDHELSDGDRPAMERHLLTCKSCFSRMEFELRLKRKLSELREVHVNPSTRKRIESLIKNF